MCNNVGNKLPSITLNIPHSLQKDTLQSGKCLSISSKITLRYWLSNFEKPSFNLKNGVEFKPESLPVVERSKDKCRRESH